jgi:hypothetical protein
MEHHLLLSNHLKENMKIDFNKIRNMYLKDEEEEQDY